MISSCRYGQLRSEMNEERLQLTSSFAPVTRFFHPVYRQYSKNPCGLSRQAARIVIFYFRVVCP